MTQYRRPKSTLKLTGVKPLDRKLKLLADKQAKAIMRNATRASLRVGADALKKEVPIGSKRKSLRKAVGTSLKRDPKLKDTVGKFGVNVGKKGRKAARGAGPVLVGTKQRRTKAGRPAGRIAGNNAMERAALKARKPMRRKLIEAVIAGLRKLKGK